jgi:hypothetical protein
MNYSNNSTTIYPRNGDKYYTDKYIMHVISNKDFYEKIIESVDKALKYFNQCKEYYFVFFIPNYNIKKRYSGKEIKELINIRNVEILNKSKIDQLFYFIYKNREYFKKIYKAIEYSKIHYFNVTDYVISIDPPNDYYNKDIYKTFNYNAKELLEIYNIAVHDKTNYNFPIPILWKKNILL